MDELLGILSGVVIFPRGVQLDLAGSWETVALVRRTWGAALEHVDHGIWQEVSESGGRLKPKPIVFGAAGRCAGERARMELVWTVVGETIRYDGALLRAWDVASGMGLVGGDGRRFRILACEPLGPDGLALDRAEGWALSDARWPVSGEPDRAPCRLQFDIPVCIMRKEDNKQVMVRTPTLVDIVVAARRRVQAYLPETTRDALAYKGLGGVIETVARDIAASPWQSSGRRPLSLYSKRQRQELPFEGVTGHIDLPHGPGPLWPLLAAAQWLQVGKHTVEGMGRFTIKPMTAMSAKTPAATPAPR